VRHAPPQKKTVLTTLRKPPLEPERGPHPAQRPLRLESLVPELERLRGRSGTGGSGNKNGAQSQDRHRHRGGGGSGGFDTTSAGGPPGSSRKVGLPFANGGGQLKHDLGIWRQISKAPQHRLELVSQREGGTTKQEERDNKLGISRGVTSGINFHSHDRTPRCSPSDRVFTPSQNQCRQLWPGDRWHMGRRPPNAPLGSAQGVPASKKKRKAPGVKKRY